MTRVAIIQSMATDLDLPVYPISAKRGQDIKDWIVIKAGLELRGGASDRGGWQYYEALCYTNQTSIAPVDSMIDRVKEWLKDRDEIELSGTITPDFYDDQLGAYMRSIGFRLPKEV